MPLNPGTKGDSYAGSMAEAIENAFLQEWINSMGPTPPSPDPQMQLLFIAIAKGVVRHLKKNQDAFKVENDFGNNLAINIKTTEDQL